MNLKEISKLTMIKETLRILAVELESAQQENKRLRRALEKTFPIELYAHLRPDVLRHCNGDNSQILQHYIMHGIDETELKDPMKTYALDMTARVIRDSKAIKNFTGVPSTKRMMQLSKTAGKTEDLKKNQDHLFAKQHTLHHYKTKTVCTWIPKNACSSLRFSFAISNGAVSGIEDIGWIHNNNDSLCASNQELLNSSYTFVILRNPYERLLSFYLDKICHANLPNSDDQSYKYAHENLNTDKHTTFEQLVNCIWNNPDCLAIDQHITPQCDFLIYTKYDDYFSVENMLYAVKTIQDKVGIELIDVRDKNSIHTSKGKSISSNFSYSTSAQQVKELLANNEKPIPSNMYTKDMIRKVTYLYLADILLYANSIKNGNEYINDWLRKVL